MFEGNAATVIGKRVGNYVVERTLAQGGMGSVFVARHPALGREAAVKFLGQDLEAPPELTKRFLDEARITANLRHPNIIDIFDFGELDGRLYYVMELLEGRDLSAVMRIKRRFSCEEVLDFLEQICAGLAAAHAVGVVHRDLKPANIFLVRGDPPRLKLMDFGVAKIMTTKGEQTRYGQIIGTPRYMSPEQALGQNDRITPQSDIYSLGIIAYEMLTGVVPFDHDSPVMLLVMHVRDPFRPIEQHAPDVPRALAELIESCLAKDPADRPASAQEILDRIAVFRRQSATDELEPASGAHSLRAVAAAVDAVDPSPTPSLGRDLFVDADTILGEPSAPTPSAAVEQALEVLSQRMRAVDDTRQPSISSSLRVTGSPEIADTGSIPTDPTLGAGVIVASQVCAAEPSAAAQPAPVPPELIVRGELKILAKDRPAAPPSADLAPKTPVPAKTPAPANTPSAQTSAPAKAATAAAGNAAPGPDKMLARDAAPENRAWANVQLHLESADVPDPSAGQLPATVNLTEADRSTLNRLLSRMQRRGDFPAFVQNVGEVSKRADFEGSFSAQQLGSSILKDYALTAKLLRIVNSAYANRFGGKIYSVQHAIVILGFDRVRSLALSTSLFKNQGNKEHAERISESAINSLVSGEIARQLHYDADLDDPEQATVCSMFRNLGKHLVLVYLPELYDQIVMLMQQEGISLNHASERVLGISMHKLGVGIAERWRLPPKMITAMSVIPERTGKPQREEDKLAALAEFSNQLCDIVAAESTTDERNAALKALLSRHKNLIQLDADDVSGLLQTTQESFEKRYSSLLGAATKTCRFARSVATLSGQGPSGEAVAAADLARSDPNAAAQPHPQPLVLTEPTPLAVPKVAAGPMGLREARAKPQVARIQLAKTVDAADAPPPVVTAESEKFDIAVAQALAELKRSGPSDQLLATLLGAVGEVLEVPRLLALRATMSRRELVIVGGFGDDVDGLTKELRLPLAAQRAATDPFSLSYHANRDFLIEDVFAPRVVSTLPQRYFEAVGSTSLLVLGCGAKGAQPLVLMGDLDPPHQLPQAERVARLVHARQAIAKVAPNANH